LQCEQAATSDVPYFEAVNVRNDITGTDFFKSPRGHSDSMIQFWRLSLPSPYWDSLIYIYMYIIVYIYIHIVVSINGGIPLSLDGFGKIPNKNSWIPRRMPSSLAPNPRGRLLLFRGARGPCGPSGPSGRDVNHMVIFDK
jgi:hypothetical protein